jgi:hypothetical protein
MSQDYHSDSLEIVMEFGDYQPIGLSVSSGNRILFLFHIMKVNLMNMDLPRSLMAKRSRFPIKNGIRPKAMKPRVL